MEFSIPYPTTPKGKAAWNKQYGLNAYWAGKHGQGGKQMQRESERKLFRNKTIFGIMIIAKKLKKKSKTY